MSKLRSIILMWGALSALISRAQDATADTLAGQLAHLDLQVPDIPAFKALGIDPSNILRPNEIKDLAMMLSPNALNDLALEWSPGRIRTGKWQRHDYVRDPLKQLWANTAFSVATKREQQMGLSPFRASAGIRIQILSKQADPLRNDSAEAFYQDAEQRFELLEVYITIIGPLPEVDLNSRRRRIMTPPDGDVESEQDAARFHTWVKRVELAEVRSIVRQTHWNKRRLDLALSMIGSSDNGTVKGLSNDAWQLWATLALEAGQQGQLLIGGTYSNSVRGDSLGIKNLATGNARFYYGKESMKGFAELQYRWTELVNKVQQPTQSLLLNLGLEARIVGNLGVVASAGLENFFEAEPDPITALRTSVDLRYHFNTTH